jgi:hypothetical protein
MAKGPSSALSGTFSHGPRATGEGDNLKQFCLLPFEEWEKVAEGRMRAPPAVASINNSLSLRGLLQQPAIDQAFGDLHGVQGSALAQVIGDNPEIDAVLDG